MKKHVDKLIWNRVSTLYGAMSLSEIRPGSREPESREAEPQRRRAEETVGQ
jgi:hypothetical protein